jgi:hypothetical protein
MDRVAEVSTVAYDAFESIIGDELVRSLPRMSADLFERLPNDGDYTAVEFEDMTHNVMIMDKDFQFLALVVRPEDHYLFAYDGVSTNGSENFYWSLSYGKKRHVLVYMFLGDCVGTCRHGRSLYSGPFTMLFERLPLGPQCNPMFFPLHNFLQGRLPVRELTEGELADH